LQFNCRCVFYDFPRVETSRLIPYLLVFVEILLFPPASSTLYCL
jgi:hypothetical protein